METNVRKTQGIPDREFAEESRAYSPDPAGGKG
jgi:hypothetical protein